MSAASDFRAHLVAQAAISTSIGTRAYPGHLPQDPTRPAIVCHAISRGHAGHLAGTAEAGPIRIQIDCHADTQIVADQVADAVVAVCKALHAAGHTTLNSNTRINDVEISGPRDTSGTPPADGSDEWEYVTSVDVVLALG